MFAVMGIPVTVGGFFGAVAQMSMVPCFSKNGALVSQVIPFIVLERFYLKSLLDCKH